MSRQWGEIEVQPEAVGEICKGDDDLEHILKLKLFLLLLYDQNSYCVRLTLTNSTSILC